MIIFLTVILFRKITQNKQESSIFSWLGFGVSNENNQSKRSLAEQEQLIKVFNYFIIFYKIFFSWLNL